MGEQVDSTNRSSDYLASGRVNAMSESARDKRRSSQALKDKEEEERKKQLRKQHDELILNEFDEKKEPQKDSDEKPTLQADAEEQEADSQSGTSEDENGPDGEDSGHIDVRA